MLGKLTTTLVVGAIIGFLMVAAVGMIYPPVITNTGAKIVCGGEVTQESETYRVPGETTVTREWFCRDESGEQHAITWLSMGASFLFFTLASGVFLFVLGRGVSPLRSAGGRPAASLPLAADRSMELDEDPSDLDVDSSFSQGSVWPADDLLGGAAGSAAATAASTKPAFDYSEPRYPDSEFSRSRFPDEAQTAAEEAEQAEAAEQAVEHLAELDRLRRSGSLTEEEFEILKQRIIDED